MTKFLLTIFFAICSHTIMAQQTKSKVEESSNAEKFSVREGSLIQKEFIEIGDIKKCDIKVVHYTDLTSGQKTSAVKFQYEYKSSYSTDTKAAFIDVDELEGLIKSIKLIQDKIFPAIPANYTEVSFRSRDGFEAGCYSKKDSWSSYMKLERFDSNSYVFMDKEDLSKLLSLLEQAKAKL
jgi:hypothetical protein